MKLQFRQHLLASNTGDPAINRHIKGIFDGERLVVKEYLATASDRKQYELAQYVFRKGNSPDGHRSLCSVDFQRMHKYRRLGGQDRAEYGIYLLETLAETIEPEYRDKLYVQ